MAEKLKIIDELDSLWWFSNVFSSSVKQTEVLMDSEEAAAAASVPEDIDENKMVMTESNLMEEKLLRSDKEEKPIPDIVSVTEQTHESSYTDSEIDETSSEFGSDFESESEPESELHGMRTSVIFMEEERNRRMKEYSGSQKFKNLGFDFGDIGLNLFLVPMIHRLPRSRNPYLVSKMPPLSDGMAMKKHLKLWAHAVACNVR